MNHPSWQGLATAEDTIKCHQMPIAPDPDFLNQVAVERASALSLLIAARS